MSQICLPTSDALSSSVPNMALFKSTPVTYITSNRLRDASVLSVAATDCSKKLGFHDSGGKPVKASIDLDTWSSIISEFKSRAQWTEKAKSLGMRDAALTACSTRQDYVVSILVWLIQEGRFVSAVISRGRSQVAHWRLPPARQVLAAPEDAQGCPKLLQTKPASFTKRRAWHYLVIRAELSTQVRRWRGRLQQEALTETS